MINYNSSHEEIIYHVTQMQMCMMSSEEVCHIKKILELQSFIDAEDVKNMIAEELQDEKWIEDTKVIIETARKRKDKHDIISSHLEDCNGLLLYKILEKKCKTYNVEIVFQNKQWIFNEVDKKEEKSRWINQKFFKMFLGSSLEKKFISMIEQGSIFTVHTEWLHKNKTLFFKESVFEDLNLTLLKKNMLKC